MTLNIGALATSCALVLVGLMATATQAAPLASAVTEFKTTAGATSSVDGAASRRCGWHKGRQHCRSYTGALPSYGHRNDMENDYYVHDSAQLRGDFER
jgi:hypothetical protein